MSNNLDRHIAVVTESHLVGHLGGPSGASSKTTDLAAVLAEFQCLPRFFEPAVVGQIHAGDFDAILFDDLSIDISKELAESLRAMNADFKPIAVIGQSALALKIIFGKDLELAGDQLTPADDYISDRDFKVLSTLGTDPKGIRRMLRELIEMA